MGSGVLAAAYAHLGRDQEARTALDIYKKGLHIHMRILERTMLFWPFKDLEVTERFADGLLKAGFHGQPSGYYKISKVNKLSGEEIRELFFGRTMIALYRSGQKGGWISKNWEDRTKDGEATWRAHADDVAYGQDDVGTSWIEGDMLCNQWNIHLSGLKHCMTVFRNPEGTPEMKNEYIGISDFGFTTWSPVD